MIARLPWNSPRCPRLVDLNEYTPCAASAVNTHATGTDPTPGKFGTIVPPSVPGGGRAGDGGGHRHGYKNNGDGDVTNLPGSDPSQSNGSGSGTGGSEGGAGGGDPVGSTHLSGDLGGGDLDAAKAGKPALGPGGQPIMPPANLGQGQGQQGAQPGAGGTGAMPGGAPNMPQMGNGALTPPKKDKKKEYKNPLDDLRTDLAGAGAGAGGAAAAAGMAGIDRGQTAHGVHTNARISGPGTNAPTNLSSSGTPPGGNASGGPQGGMARGGMMGGPLGSGSASGSRGAKKADDTPAAFQDRAMSGEDSIREGVEGGIISRNTSSEPEPMYPEHPDEVAKRKAQRAAEEQARLEEERRRNSPPPGWE